MSTRSLRLSVRTRDFHSLKRSSTLLRTTIMISCIAADGCGKTVSGAGGLSINPLRAAWKGTRPRSYYPHSNHTKQKWQTTNQLRREYVRPRHVLSTTSTTLRQCVTLCANSAQQRTRTRLSRCSQRYRRCLTSSLSRTSSTRTRQLTSSQDSLHISTASNLEKIFFKAA